MSILRLTLLVSVLAAAAACQDLDFKSAERQIVRLPPSAFPMLPGPVARELQRRGCTIPQAFTKAPNNVISGEFAKRGQTDWAVLCSIKGSSSILVFWKGSPDNPADLSAADDMNYLQGGEAGKIVYSRSISAVGSKFITQHFDAYGGQKPPPVDHDGIDDAFLEKASSVQYFFNGKWLQLTGSD